jgi:hypothetical protein
MTYFKKTLLFYLVLIALVACNSNLTRNVSFVKIQASKLPNGNRGENIRTYDIFIDGLGSIYPDQKTGINFFDSAQIVKNNGRINNYLTKNPNNLNLILDSLKISAPNSITIKDSLKIYQEFVLKNTLKNIKEEIETSHSEQLIILIHGFNNHYYDCTCNSLNTKKCEFFNPNIVDINSKTSYEKVTNFFEKKYPNKKLFVIQIYWNGLYSYLEKGKSKKIWTYAQTNSYPVGLAVRKLLSGLPDIKTNVITHSLGANVICSALFNLESKLDPAYVEGYSDIKNQYSLNDLSKKRINVAMIAPAMPGANTFVDMLNPNLNPSNNNYNFIIGFNEQDPVTTKGPLKVINGAYHFGATSLASKRDDLFLTKTILNEKMQIVDFSANFQIQISHRFIDYIDNENFETLIKLMLD